MIHGGAVPTLVTLFGENDPEMLRGLDEDQIELLGSMLSMTPLERRVILRAHPELLGAWATAAVAAGKIVGRIGKRIGKSKLFRKVGKRWKRSRLFKRIFKKRRRRKRRKRAARARRAAAAISTALAPSVTPSPVETAQVQQYQLQRAATAQRNKMLMFIGIPAVALGAVVLLMPRRQRG